MNKVFQHGDYVNVDFAKTGDNSLLHATVETKLTVLFY